MPLLVSIFQILGYGAASLCPTSKGKLAVYDIAINTLNRGARYLVKHKSNMLVVGCLDTS